MNISIDSSIAMLKDPEPFNRRIGASRLSMIKNEPRVVEALLAARQESDDQARAAIISALGAVGDARVGSILLDALKDNYWGVQVAAASSLAAIGDTRAIDPLIEKLADTSEEVRRSAASALATIGDERIVGPFLALIAGNSKDLCRSALRGLTRIGDERGVAVIIQNLASQDPGFQSDCRNALETLAGKAVESLIVALHDSNKYIRENAAFVLGKIKDVRAVDPLINVLQRDTERDVRSSAARGLGLIKDSRAIQPLFTALLDPEIGVHIAVTSALNKMGCTQEQIQEELAKLQAEQVKAQQEGLVTARTDDLRLKKCPYCGNALPKGELSLMQNDLVIDAQMECPSCRRTIRKSDLM